MDIDIDEPKTWVTIIVIGSIIYAGFMLLCKLFNIPIIFFM